MTQAEQNKAWRAIDDILRGYITNADLSRDLQESAEKLGLRPLIAKVGSARMMTQPDLTEVVLVMALNAETGYKNTFAIDDLEIHLNAANPRCIADLIQCRYDHAKAELLALVCEPRADEPAIVENKT